MPHIPQELGTPVQEGPASLDEPLLEANTDSFLVSLAEPHTGHFAPFQLLERTRISLSFSHFSQWNS